MSEQYLDLSLSDYWRVVRRRKLIVLAGVVTCVAGALSMTVLQRPVYVGEAHMAVRSLPGGSIFGSDYFGNVDPKRTIATEIEVLQSYLVLQQAKQNLGLVADPPEVHGSVVGATDVVSVKVRSGSQVTAQTMADAYVQAYIDVKREQTVAGLNAASAELESHIPDIEGQISAIDQQIDDTPASQRDQVEREFSAQRQALVNQLSSFNERLDQMQIDAALSSGGAQLVQPASLPSDPVEPTPLHTSALAVVVGLLLGLGAAFLLDYADDTLRSTTELEAAAGGLPVLSVVPVDKPPDSRPISISRPDDFAIEAYRTLRTNLQFLGVDRPLRTIQITSSVAGEGKTTTAANLAVLFAQAGNRVLLIDADLRRPRLHEVFAVDGQRGLTDALLGEPAELMTHDISVPGGTLLFLPAGRVPANPSELLGGRRMKALLQQLSGNFDVVVLDSAPVIPVTDSVVLSGSVDALLIVAQANRTSSKQVNGTVRALNRVSAPLAGVIMNRVGERKLRSDQYGYGYGSKGNYAPREGADSPVEDRRVPV